MSATTVLSQLKTLLEKTEQLKGKFSKVYPTDDQWDTLSDLSLKLSEASKAVQDNIRVLKESRSERAWKESEEHRSKAQSSRGDLFAKGRLKQPAIFRRNIATIFEGPKDSKFDSDDVKFRKESTRKRCKLIRRLSPDGVISWALSFAPTLWAGGSMAEDVFTCLLDDIEPELVQTWPSVIRETLHLLMEDEESLRQCPEYDGFLKAIDDPSRKPVQQRKAQSTDQPRKRRRVSDGSASEDEVLSSGQTRELVARTPDGQHASKGVKSPNEATETPVNSQVAVRDGAGLSQGVLRLFTNGRQLIAKASTTEKTNTESIKYGDVFALNIEDARYALSCDQNVTQIFVTNPKTANKIGDKSSFLTAWISEDLGELLSKRGQLVNY